MYEELVKKIRALTAQETGIGLKTQAEAADAIEELVATVGTAYNDLANNEANKPRWIPVTERLPEKHVFVLVRSKFVKMRTDFINNDGKWYTTPGVTHWMPLPEPPKEE